MTRYPDHAAGGRISEEIGGNWDRRPEDLIPFVRACCCVAAVMVLLTACGKPGGDEDVMYRTPAGMTINIDGGARHLEQLVKQHSEPDSADSAWAQEYVRRAKEAITLLQNGTVDATPMLLIAQVRAGVDVGLIVEGEFVDETADVVAIRLRQRDRGSEERGGLRELSIKEQPLIWQIAPPKGKEWAPVWGFVWRLRDDVTAEAEFGAQAEDEPRFLQKGVLYVGNWRQFDISFVDSSGNESNRMTLSVPVNQMP